MPLEACMIVVDNSEFMRNGDYTPTRFEAQNDAVSVVFNAKTGSNPENTVGVMSMAGQSPQVLATLTQDIGKILSALSSSKFTIGGTSDLITSLNVAQLALKHRENKNQRQRIICFVGSPLSTNSGGGSSSSSYASTSAINGGGGDSVLALESELVKLGKKLKKNNVAVDVVCFGDEGIEGESVLSKFVEAVGSSDNSHLVTIPQGPHLLSDILSASPILAGEFGGVGGGGGVDADGFPTGDFGGAPGGGGGGGGGGGAHAEYGGIDPDMDPEMAMAIRMSMQEAEERERRDAAAAAASAGTSSSTATETETKPAVPTDSESAPLLSSDVSMEEEEPKATPTPAASSSTTTAPVVAAAAQPTGDVEMVPADDDDDEDEEAAMLKAIAMSMEDQAEEEKKDGK